MARRTLKEKAQERAQKRNLNRMNDAINKLKDPHQPVTNGLPDAPTTEAIAKDTNGKTYRRNSTNTAWLEIVDTGNYEEIHNTIIGDPGEGGLVIEAVEELPSDFPYSEPNIVWYDGQLWGTGPGASRWYPMMRFTLDEGI